MSVRVRTIVTDTQHVRHPCGPRAAPRRRDQHVASDPRNNPDWRDSSNDVVAFVDIDDARLGTAIDLLVEGFPSRTRAYWEQGLACMRACAEGTGRPPYGILLNVDGTDVGVMLVIVSPHVGEHGTVVFANLSSWFVRKPFRAHSKRMFAHAVSAAGVTFTDLSAAPNVFRTLDNNGFVRWETGQVVAPCLPRLPFVGTARVCAVAEVDGDAWTQRMLQDHAAYGCEVFAVRRGGRARPYVFARRGTRVGLKLAQIVYCPSVQDLAQDWGALGVQLLLRGYVAGLFDLSAVPAGMLGVHLAERGYTYFKGVDAPGWADHAYSELAVLGP